MFYVLVSERLPFSMVDVLDNLREENNERIFTKKNNTRKFDTIFSKK